MLGKIHLEAIHFSADFYPINNDDEVWLISLNI